MTSTDIFLKCFNEEIADLPIWFHSYRFVRQCGQVGFDLVFPSELNNEVYSFQRLMDMMTDEILETATGGQVKDVAEFGIHHITTTRSEFVIPGGKPDRLAQ